MALLNTIRSRLNSIFGPEEPPGPGPDVIERPEGMTAYQGYEWPPETERRPPVATPMPPPVRPGGRAGGYDFGKGLLAGFGRGIPQLRQYIPEEAETEAEAAGRAIPPFLGFQSRDITIPEMQEMGVLGALGASPWIGAPARALSAAIKPSLTYGKTATRAYAAPTLGEFARGEAGAIKLPSYLTSARIKKFLSPNLEVEREAAEKLLEGNFNVKVSALAGPHPNQWFIALQVPEKQAELVAKRPLTEIKGISPEGFAGLFQRPGQELYFKDFNSLKAFLQSGEYVKPDLKFPLPQGPVQPLYQSGQPIQKGKTPTPSERELRRLRQRPSEKELATRASSLGELKQASEAAGVQRELDQVFESTHTEVNTFQQELRALEKKIEEATSERTTAPKYSAQWYKSYEIAKKPFAEELDAFRVRVNAARDAAEARFKQEAAPLQARFEGFPKEIQERARKEPELADLVITEKPPVSPLPKVEAPAPVSRPAAAPVEVGAPRVAEEPDALVRARLARKAGIPLMPDEETALAIAEKPVPPQVPSQPAQPVVAPEAAPAAPVQVPTMITRKMEADLRAKGFTQQQIDKMSPAEAWEKLGGMPRPAAAPVEAVAPRAGEPVPPQVPSQPAQPVAAGAGGPQRALRLGPGRALPSDEPPPTPGLPRRADYYNPRNVEHDVVDDKGNVVGTVKMRLAEDLRVDRPGVTAIIEITASGGQPFGRENANRFGVASIRDLQKQLQEEYPEIKRFQGWRVTGTRQVGHVGRELPIAEVRAPVGAGGPLIPKFKGLTREGLLPGEEPSSLAFEQRLYESAWTVQKTELEAARSGRLRPPGAEAMEAFRKGNWAKYSRDVGYTGEEIAQYEQYQALIKRGENLGYSENDLAAISAQAREDLQRGAGAGGVVPPTGPVTPATPPGPAPVRPGAVQRALDVADAIVQRDKPGLLTRFQMMLPGMKQIRGGLQRALVMPEKTLKAWVAQGNARGLVSNELGQERLPAMQRLSQMFGGASISGEGKVTARFIGSTEQARYPWTNTLRDVLEYPELYDLSPEQRTFVNALGEARDARFGAMKDAYGLKVGQFGRRPGAVFLSNYDVSESALDLYGTAERAGRIGRARERFYEGARERWTHDVAAGKEFKPDTNVSRLLYNMDESLSGMAGKRVYTEGLGGRTKLQVMQETHPALAAKMDAFNKRLRTLAGRESRLEARQKQAIEDYLASPMEDEDIGLLRDGLEPALRRGPAQGQTLPEVQRELAGIRAQGEALRKSWRIANPKPYTRIQEGGNLYFKADEAEHIKRLAQTSSNPIIWFVDNLRATAFGGDLSPATIQGLTAWFSDPVGVTRLAAGELKQAAKSRQLLRPFTEQGILDDIAKDTQGWRRFTEATGINPLQGPGAEFTTGFLGKIPRVGKGWEAFNEGIYRPLQKLSKDIFDSSFQASIKRGLTEEQAMAVAADDATKMIPNWNPRRLGLSQAESARYRALLTSVSFLTQPIALTTDAVKGLVKLGLRKPVTPSEGFAMKRVLTLVAATEALAVLSNVKYAHDNGLDPTKAALDSLNPDSGKFMSIVLPNGDRVGIGGPFRSLIRGIAPRTVSWSPVPVPFGGLAQFATSKEHPALRVVTDELRNEDFYGNKIRTGEFPMNVVQGLEYAFAQSAPLTVGTAAGELMAGKTPQEAAQQAAYQFAGTNVAPLTPSQTRNEAVQAESIKAGLPDVESYYDLPGRERHAWDVVHPEVAANILAETKRRAENGDQTARYQLEKQRIYDEMVALQEAVQKGTLNGEPYGRLQFKDDYRDRQLEMAAARKTYEAIVKPTYKKAETQKEKDVEAYYALMDKFRLPAGKFDIEGWDKAETDFLDKLDQGRRRDVEGWLHAHEPPLATELREAKETLRPYWELKDGVLDLRSQTDPNIKRIVEKIRRFTAEGRQEEAAILRTRQDYKDYISHIERARDRKRRRVKAVDEAGRKWYGWLPLKEP